MIEYFYLREHSNSLDNEKEHAPHFAQQHNLKTTCHIYHFHCARLHCESMCTQIKPPNTKQEHWLAAMVNFRKEERKAMYYPSRQRKHFLH